MRGTPDVFGHRAGAAGIIPAYAGNTWKPHRSQPPTRDQPRVCGEHCARSQAFEPFAGSSPRMRGTLTSKTSSRTLSGDHPRVCGEHHVTQIFKEESWGSSPRMRGTPGGREVGVREHGIIPAYAGNTWTNAYDPGENRDHPRVCGEHYDCGQFVHDVQGSSPRMRGTPSARWASASPSGIIPAYAGNTAWR